MFQAILVEEGETVSEWLDLRAEYAPANADRESWSMTINQLVWPTDHDLTTVDVEVAHYVDGVVTAGGPLYDTDGGTNLSTITAPLTGLRTRMKMPDFALVQAVRIKLPAEATDDWTFSIGIRPVR